ncbi:MAG TPA: hypothetical protein VKE30_08620 [Chthoniobacterales bacterium]|nr:hypothetical protein [Chthoniobacterales bacterium]
MNGSTAERFLFNWNAPRDRNLAILGFLFASFAGHAACFYLFQVVYPPTVSLTPAPQRVSLISVNSEQAVTFLRWIDAEDPALVSTTRRPPYMRRREIGKVEQIPSYFAREPALKEAPPLAVDLRVPSVQPPGPVPSVVRVPAKPVGVTPTKVTFSNEFDQFGQPAFVPTQFKASNQEPPQNAQFRVAVDSAGAVRYCFRLNSSGDAALDEQVRQHLARYRFPARLVPGAVERSTSNGDSLVWGIATIEWGNDVVAANAKPSPTAP